MSLSFFMLFGRSPSGRAFVNGASRAVSTLRASIPNVGFVACGSAGQAADPALYVSSRTGPGEGYVIAHPARRPGAE